MVGSNLSKSIRKRVSHTAVTPLPRGQVASVLLLQMCESLQITVLFPFLVFMIEDFGFTDDNLGYYVGGLAASFCTAQFVSSVLWGKFSDRFGRKLALFLGCVGAAIAVCVFGSSQTYTQAVIARIVSGLLNGNIGVLKSFLTEITDDTNRSYGFALLSFAWGLGSILAPLIGGALCKPADKYPYIFSKGGIFDTLPYLLPCVIVMVLQLITAVCIFFFMRETRPVTGVMVSLRAWLSRCFSQTSTRSPTSYETVSLDEDGSGVQMQQIAVDIQFESDALSAEGIENLSTKSMLSTQSSSDDWFSSPTRHVLDDVGLLSPQSEVSKAHSKTAGDSSSSSFLTPLVWITTGNYGMLCLAYIIWEETMPLYFKLDVSKGGLALNSSEIGFALSLGGASLLVFTLLCLPPLERRFGKFWMMFTGLVACVPVVALWPMQSALLNRYGNTAMWIGIIMGVCMQNVFGAMTFTAVMIFVNHSVSDENLGAVNGFGQSMAAMARAVGPAMGGALWSLSIAIDFVYLNFLIAGLCLVVCVIITQFTPRSLEFKYGTALDELLE